MLQLTMWYLLKLMSTYIIYYMCEKVHVRACMQCRREFADMSFHAFPSFSQSMLTPTYMFLDPYGHLHVNKFSMFKF